MSPSQPSNRLHVLHLTESFGAGVATVIRQYMEFPGAQQSLLAYIRNDSASVQDVVNSEEGRDYLISRKAFLARWMALRRTN